LCVHIYIHIHTYIDTYTELEIRTKYIYVHICTYTRTYRDTILPTRFPIGLEKQVRDFNADDFKAFYARHYYPENMCVYVTGDIDTSVGLF